MDNFESQNVLVIDVPGVWVTNKVPAITKEQAGKQKELLKFHLENRTFDKILTFEVFTKDFAGQSLRGGELTRLDSSFQMEELVSRTFNGIVYARLAEITEIDVPFPEALSKDFEIVDAEGLSRFERLEYQANQQKRLAALLP